MIWFGIAAGLGVASLIFLALHLALKRKPKIIVRAHLVGVDESIEGEYGGESKNRIIIRGAMLLMPNAQKRDVGDVWIRWEKVHFLQEIDREMKP